MKQSNSSQKSKESKYFDELRNENYDDSFQATSVWLRTVNSNSNLIDKKSEGIFINMKNYFATNKFRHWLLELLRQGQRCSAMERKKTFRFWSYTFSCRVTGLYKTKSLSFEWMILLIRFRDYRSFNIIVFLCKELIFFELS